MLDCICIGLNIKSRKRPSVCTASVEKIVTSLMDRSSPNLEHSYSVSYRREDSLSSLIRSSGNRRPLPYLTLPSGWAGCYPCPALRPYQLGPMLNPDVTAGHISLLVVLANRIREIGWTLRSSSFINRCDPKMEYRSCIRAGHVARKW